MNPHSTYSDAYLLELLRAGDEVAFTEIYDRYWDRLFGMAFNRLKEIETAEDAVHDVFLALWKNKERTEIKSLPNYLASSLKYIVLRQIYRQQIHKNYVVEKGSAIHVEMKPDEMDFVALLGTELDKLPPKCRVVFEYSRIDGFSNKEIAEKLDISVKTVENQINTAQKQLRVAFKNSYLLLLLFLQ